MKGDIILYQNQTKTYMVIGLNRWNWLTSRLGLLKCFNCHGPILPGDFCFTRHKQARRRGRTYCGYCACHLGMC